ncbi:MAG: hypothetical protein COU10_01615 [Candidatus Harrisonbacteria bacterium CG10_big_fil_rev_8_21_14_0_10_45_28]|uniref:diaminopimelate epimerase n=1 Tax=Candidatus Harrisonbacteria bacterium CG10_big_fil_rev_8_21_14_0_10_45_28 TaxID=1974586 RepID=A0A2H0UNJ0_9BACT|nr:MAG: hypothetical protein COU10_01615 [Candidatus Harrisonbacteria bacterium CG10_big_fil_rev_8_21_14_0_10_45_28]
MGVQFFKYSGLGNDFVFVEERTPLATLPDAKKQYWSDAAQKICDRHLGVGADGLVLFRVILAKDSFEMLNINPDGSFSTMCGNASRCAVMHFF